MPLKKVSSEEFIKIVKKETGLDLFKPSMTIYIGPYFEKLDVMFPSVIIAIILGWIVSVYVPDKA